LLSLGLLRAQRCQPRDRFCTDISMTVTIGGPGVDIPDCVNNGPLPFQKREVVTFPGLTPELTTAEVTLNPAFFGIQVTPTAAAVPGTVAVTLHDVPDPNFPNVTDDYTIHVTFVTGSADGGVVDSGSAPDTGTPDAGTPDTGVAPDSGVPPD
jgi:hypothetical protein